MDESSSKRFASSLKSVAEEFGTSVSVVLSWRDRDECQFLMTKPYDKVAIRKWLDARVANQLSDEGGLERRKLEAEVEGLETKNSILSKDKSFWMAAAALGIVLSKEVRDWLDEDDRKSDSTRSGRKSERRECVISVSRQTYTELERYCNIQKRSMAQMTRFILNYAVTNKDAFKDLLSSVPAGKNSERVNFFLYRPTDIEIKKWAKDLEIRGSLLIRLILTKYLEMRFQPEFDFGLSSGRDNHRHIEFHAPGN